MYAYYFIMCEIYVTVYFEFINDVAAWNTAHNLNITLTASYLSAIVFLWLDTLKS